MGSTLPQNAYLTDNFGHANALKNEPRRKNIGFISMKENFQRLQILLLKNVKWNQKV